MMLLCLVKDCAALSLFPSGLSLRERILDVMTLSIKLVSNVIKYARAIDSCTGVYVIFAFKYGKLNHGAVELGLREPLYVREIQEFFIGAFYTECGGAYIS